jgi:hypothetical protein
LCHDAEKAFEKNQKKEVEARWQIADIPIAQQQPTTLTKRKTKRPQKTHKRGSHNQRETKPSLNPQTEKQLTTGRMGRMICSLTFLIPSPLKLPCSSRLHYPVLCPTPRHTQELGALLSLNTHPEMPGKPVPLCNQVPWLLLFQDNKRHSLKPVSAPKLQLPQALLS